MSSNLVAMIQVLLISSLVISIHAYAYYNCSTCHSFSSKALGLSLSDVKNILVDEENEKIYVAAKNMLLRLNPSLSYDNSSYEYLELPPSEKQVQDCESTNSIKKHCSNYMRLLVFDNDNKVLACGTYATKPRCWRIQRTGQLIKLSVVKNSNTRSPRFPDQNVSGVISDHPVKNGYLFTGLNNNEPGTKSSAIFREAVNISLDAKSYLRTVDADFFLKDANFVSSYTAPDSFVYFYWREKAIEVHYDGVYSRVGRVCSYDKGGAFTKLFTSFTKSRLLCAVPGKEKFAYNYLQSTFKYMKGSSEIIYGIFTTPESGVTGSAVCTYSFKDIQSVFSTSKYLEEVQIDNVKALKAVPPPIGEIPGRPACNASLNTKAYKRDTNTFAKSHPLLEDSVGPFTGKPLLIMPNIRFTQVAVDSVKALIGGIIQAIPVLFLATGNGTIYKVAEGITPDKKAKIVEQINVFKGARPIQSLKLYKNSLYVGCSSAITKVSTHRCSNHKTCRSCVELQDPYCGWSNNICTTKDNAKSSSWIQDVAYGRFNNVCPEDPPTCSLQMATNNPGGTTVLECTIQGIPVPAVTKWHFNGQQIKIGPRYTRQDMKYSQKLSVHKFGLKNLGDYECTVQNNKGQSHSCKLSIKGTLPVVSSGFFKRAGHTYFWCKAKGIPKPKVRRYKVIGGLVQRDTTAISEDHGTRSYYCIAQNKFGLSIGQNFTLNERKLVVKMKLTKEDWDEDLQNSDTSKYKMLSIEVRESIAQVYSNNTVFMETTRVTFSKGSVVANAELRFVCKQSDTNAMLLTDLQQAIFTGKVGSLQVERRSIIKQYAQVPTPGYRFQDQGMDTGLFVVAVLVAIVLSVILGFILGIKFHRQVLSSCGPKKHDSPIEEDKDIQGIKCIKSPTIDNSRNCTDEKLLNKDGDGDSVRSCAGGFNIIDPSKTPENKSLVNGKTPKSC